uniref:Uncharacterized protein n=1 Tax=viral metagenome TaxID=1070528 RepID=A0A6H1ZUT2_9ZZZZ
MTIEQLERWLWDAIQWLKRINHPARPALLSMWCNMSNVARDPSHWDLSHPGQPAQGWAGVRGLLPERGESR